MAREAEARRVRSATVALFCVAAIGFCCLAWIRARRGAGEPAPVSASEDADLSNPEVVVVLDGVQYTRAQFRSYLGSETPFATIEEARAALEQFADHLLLQRRGAAAGDEAALDALAVESLPGVRDDDVAEYYAAHRDRFVHPRQVSLAFLRIALGPTGDRTPLDTAYVLAQGRPRPESLAAIARQVGGTSGHAGPLSCTPEPATDAGAPGVVPFEVVRATCESAAGLSPPVIVGEAAYVVIKTGEQPAANVGLERAAPAVRRQLEREALVQGRRRALEKLRAGARIALADVEVRGLVAAPVAPEAGAGPGGPPMPPIGDGDPDA